MALRINMDKNSTKTADQDDQNSSQKQGMDTERFCICVVSAVFFASVICITLEKAYAVRMEVVTTNSCVDSVLSNFHTSEQYKTLTQVYGKYFAVAEATIAKAVEDERLRTTVNDLLKTRPTHPAIINPTIKSATVKLSSPIKNIFEFSIFSPDANTNTLTSEFKLSETGESNTELANLNTETRQLSEKFTNLMTDSPSVYLQKKKWSFKLKGNLNLWEYFVQESQNQDFSILRHNRKLEIDSDGFIYTATDTYPVRVSADGNYLLYDKLIDGQRFKVISQRDKVSVTTQLSIDRLHTFVESYVHWNGPISLAVFLNGPMEYFVLRSYLSFIKRCHPHQFERTRFSIVTPIDDPIPRDVFIQTTDFDDTSCAKNSTDINEILKPRITKTVTWLKTEWYPQNTMRNVARKNILTDYHITLDVDIMPCAKMSEGINKLLANGSNYTHALVVPTYEISRKVPFPQKKSELVSLTRKGMAQPFHKDVYLPNQNATNFPKWEKVHDSFEDVHVVHEVSQFPIHYEPFFVELNANPMYHEEFVGYGFTRSSHAYEVFLKSGNFLILSPIFTVQLGIQKAKQWSTSRQEQNEHNRERFDNLIKKLQIQYNFTTEQ